MLSRFLRRTSSSVTFAALLIGAASLFSRLIGVLRDRLLSGAFGAGRELDIYYAAFRVPDLVYNLVIGGVITAGFIPVFTRYLGKDASPQKGMNAEASGLADVLLTALGALLAVGATLGIVFAPRFIPTITPGFSPADMAETVRITRIMFLSPIFLGLSNVLGGILQTKRRFVVYSFAPVLYNVGIVGGTIFLAPQYGVYGPTIGVVIGSFLHFAAQLVAAMNAGYRFRFAWHPRHEGVVSIAKLTLPRLASLGAAQANLLVVTGMASTLGAGSIAVFTLANNLQTFPTSIIGVSFAIAAFPLISSLAASGNREAFAKQVARTVRNILFLVIPATVCMLLLRAQIVRVVLGTDRFSWDDTIATANALAFFSLSLFTQALWPLLARACFAMEDALSPLWAAVAGIVIERAVAIALVGRGMGTPGLALALSVGSITSVVWLWAALRRRAGSLDERAILRSVAMTTLAATAMALALQFTKQMIGTALGTETFWTVLAQGAGAGTVGIAVFIGVAYLLGSEEAKNVVAMYSRRFAPVPVPEIHQDDGGLGT